MSDIKSQLANCLLSESLSSISEGERDFTLGKSNFLGDTYDTYNDNINNNNYIMGNLTVPKKNFEDKDEQQQKELLKNYIIKLTVHKRVRRIFNGDPLIYYERHKSGYIHAHVLLPILEEYAGYEFWNSELNKAWKYIVKGRKISGLFKTVFDYEGAKKYCMKEQTE